MFDISEEQYDAVKNLGKLGLSQRQISQRLRLGRGTVTKVLESKEYVRHLREAVRVNETESTWVSKDFVWCPKCGVKVRQPCLACRVRITKEQKTF